jgi:hypothetical protein
MDIDLETSERFLDYHDDNIVGAYETLEKGDIAAISQVDQGLIYEFRLHRAFFDYAGIFTLSSFLLLKIGNVLGVQIAILKNVLAQNKEGGRYGILDDENQSLFKDENPVQQATFQEEYLSETIDNHLDTNFNIDTPQQTLTPDEVIAFQEDSKSVIVREETDLLNSTDYIAKTGENTVTNEPKKQEFIKRQYATPTLGKIMLIAGIVVIVAGVAQMLVDNLYTVIPADKAGAIQQMQAEL